MAVSVIRYCDRPELGQQITQLSDEVWPEYNVHGEVIDAYWPLLYERFAEFQFVLYDDQDDAVLAEGQTIPCTWDGTAEHLGPGIDDTITAAFALHDSGGDPTRCVRWPPRFRRGTGTSARQCRLDRDARDCGAVGPAPPDRSGAAQLEGPLPDHPDRALRALDTRRRHRVRSLDPRPQPVGRIIGPPLPRSMRITGTVEEWETWTGMRFPETGDYVFPDCLAPLHVNTQRDLGKYWEPNVWLVHPSLS